MGRLGAGALVLAAFMLVLAGLFFVLWRVEAENRQAADQRLAEFIRGQEIAQDVHDRNSARAEEIGKALREAIEANPDTVDDPLDPFFRDLVDRVRRETGSDSRVPPASGNGPS